MIFELQKASILKRISAFLLDFILVCILAVGFAALVMLIDDFDTKYSRYNEIITEYSEKHGVDLLKGLDENASDAEKEKYKEAYKDFVANDEATGLYGQILTAILISVTVGLFVGELIVEFVLPLIFRNGQTLGKKIFGIAVMQISGVKITPPILFIRAVLGKYVVETMLPVLLLLMVVSGAGGLLMLIILGALAVLELVLVIATKNNSFLHDAISSTVVVDMATQVIFDSKKQMIEYKEQAAQQEAETKPY